MRSLIRSAAVAASGIALVAALFGCAAPEEARHETLRVGIPAGELVAHDIVTLHPDGAGSDLVYETLFNLNSQTGELLPNLATSVEQSEDWTSLTITLREGVTFSDGETLNAEGLKTYLDGVMAHEDYFMHSGWVDFGAEVHVVDEYTVRIDFNRPVALYAFVPDNFLRAARIASPALLDHLDEVSTETYGSGPYVVADSVAEVSVTLEKNPDYWNADAFPYDTIELHVFADEVARLNALESGQIDATTRITAPYAVQAERSGFVVSEIPGRFMAVYVADRSGTDVPALGDQRVRQAMALAFDREEILARINLGYGTTSSQPFGPVHREYVEGGDNRYGYDPERAIELLTEAGYPEGFDLVILTSDLEGISTWEPVVQQYLGEIGIRVTFERLETNAYYTAVVSGEYPVTLFPETGLFTVDVFVTKDAIINSYKVDDPIIADLYQATLEGPDEAAQRANKELGEYVLDQAFVIPFSFAASLVASDGDLGVNLGSMTGGYGRLLPE